MRYLGPEAIDAALDFRDTVNALREAFRAGFVAPPRHHHTIEKAGGSDATLLLMPAWTCEKGDEAGHAPHIGVKVVTVFPDNEVRGLPSVQGSYLLISGEDGKVQAVLDGTRLTLWRTAAASALAATYLAPAGAGRLTMIGAGALAPFLIEAHAAVRPIRHVSIWNRTRAHAQSLARRMAGRPFHVDIADDLERAVATADIVSAATLSPTPLIRGAWLRPGCHVDLVGAFRAEMRESDDTTLARARIFVDTRDGALHEAGDIVQALKSGAIATTDIIAELCDLVRGRSRGRESDEEITLFKSVGTAIEDLAVAMLVHSRTM